MQDIKTVHTIDGGVGGRGVGHAARSGGVPGWLIVDTGDNSDLEKEKRVKVELETEV